MTHQYENAAEWFIRMCSTNNWSHSLYTYIAGVCYAELSHRQPNSPELAKKATSLLESVPGLLHQRKSFGGRRIPFEQYVDRKINRFKARAGNGRIIDGISGPVTEEIIYLLCNGHKRMTIQELEKSRESLEIWGRIAYGEEEKIAMGFMNGVIDRNAGRLDEARKKIEKVVIAEGLSQRVPLGSNDWISGFAYYEVCLLWKHVLMADGSDKLVARSIY